MKNAYCKNNISLVKFYTQLRKLNCHNLNIKHVLIIEEMFPNIFAQFQKGDIFNFFFLNTKYMNILKLTFCMKFNHKADEMIAVEMTYDK